MRVQQASKSQRNEECQARRLLNESNMSDRLIRGAKIVGPASAPAVPADSGILTARVPRTAKEFLQ